jgi:hypothetical protein
MRQVARIDDVARWDITNGRAEITIVMSAQSSEVTLDVDTNKPLVI